MKIGLIINKDKTDSLVCAKEIVSLLKDDAKIIVTSEFINQIKVEEYFESEKEVIKNSDITITIGGDGTIIHAAYYAARYNKPLIGVNLGRIGFVAGIERNELSELKKLITGEYEIQNRMLLNAKLKSIDKSYIAVNDICVSRDSFSSMVDLEVSLNDEKIITYRADGMVFSTATGSTAYSFSAGGPVIEPDMKCILLNPICPHALSSRPVVFSDESKLNVKLREKNSSKCYFSVDGKNISELTQDDDLIIEKSDYELKLIILKKKNFYTLLNEKLKEDD